MKRVIVAMVLAAAVGAFASAQEWKAAEQPNLGDQINGAPQLPVEEVGSSIRSTTRGELMRIPNPDGESLDLIQWYFQGYSGPTHGIVIDTGTNEIKTISIPDNLQIHIAGNIVGPDGKLYITTPWWYRSERKGMELMVYDPAANEFEQRGVIAPRLGYENRPMTIGTNGKIYGASSYPDLAQPGAYEIDTETGEVIDFGPFGPSYRPVGCWVSGVAADDEYIYVATRNNPKYIISLNRETREWKVLVTAENVGGLTGVSQGRYGATGSASKIIGAEDQGSKRYWLYKGEAIEITADNQAPPWPVPQERQPAEWVRWPRNVEVFNANTNPDSDGNAEIWYRIGGARPGETPEAQGWVKAAYTVPVYPRTLNHLIELADGRIFGSASGYGGGNFIYDPEKDETEYLGKITGLSQYSRVAHDGKVYMSGYPSSPLFIYDTELPWTANKWVNPGERQIGESDRGSNPRMRMYLREFSGTHYARSATIGGDGKIFFGGVWARDASSGGLAWWDPARQEAGGFWQDLSNVAVSNITTTGGGNLIVMSASPVPDRLLNKDMPENGQLIVYDIIEAKIVRHIEPVPGQRNPGPIAGAGGNRIIGICGDPENRDASILYGVDVATGEVAFRKPLPVSGAGREMRVGPDGAIWTVFGETLVRIAPEDATIEAKGKVGRVGHMAFSGGDIYFGGGELLRRVRGAYEQ